MKKILLYFFLIILSINTIAQENQDSSSFINEGHYIGVSGGIAISSLRDLGTSPLFYTGILPSAQLSHIYYFGKNIWNFKFTTLNGVYLHMTDIDMFSASGNIFDFEFSFLHNYAEEGNEYRTYIGTSLNNFSSFRNNSSFMNASFAFDNISYLNLDYKFEYDWVRKEKQKKLFWLFKYTRKEKRYVLGAKVGIPVFSMLYRPGYTYLGNATNSNNTLFPGYEWNYKVFPGLNTDLSISRVLNNGNQMKLSYYWDFMTTGKLSENRLEQSKHMLLYTLIFNLN